MDPWLGNWSRLHTLPGAAKKIELKTKKKRKAQSAAGAKRSSWPLDGNDFMQRGHSGWALKAAQAFTRGEGGKA